MIVTPATASRMRAAAAPPRRPAAGRGLPPVRPVTVLTAVALTVAMAAVGGLAVGVSTQVAAGVYAVGFLALALVRLDLAFLLVFAEAPFVWDVGGGPVNMALPDLSFAMAAAVFLVRGPVTGRTVGMRGGNPVFWPVLAYLLVCVASIVVNGSAAASAVTMVQMVLYLVVAVSVYSRCVGRNPAQAIVWLQGLIVVDTALSLVVLGLRSSSVLGLQKNAVGLEVGYAVNVAVELWLARAASGRPTRWLTAALVLLTGALVLSLSRGSWVGTLVGVGVTLALRNRRLLMLKLGLYAVPVVAAFWVLLPSAAKDYATDVSTNSYNVEARLESIQYAMHFFWQSPVLGAGVGLRKTYDATNVAVSLLAETGVLGLVTFASIFVVFLALVWRATRRVNPADPRFSLLVLGAALMAGSFVHGLVDHYWNRGLLPVWALVGLAVYAAKRPAMDGRPGPRPRAA